MADRFEKVTEQKTTDAEGRTVVTRTASADSQDRQVNKVNQIIWFIFGVLIVLIALRVVLSLIGANADNQFANLIYSVTNIFVSPFRGLLQVGEFQAGVSRFEFESIVAILIYSLLGWGITAAVNLVKKNPEA